MRSLLGWSTCVEDRSAPAKTQNSNRSKNLLHKSKLFMQKVRSNQQQRRLCPTIQPLLRKLHHHRQLLHLRPLNRTACRRHLLSVLSESLVPSFFRLRSEERRVGKESRSRWSPYH